MIMSIDPPAKDEVRGEEAERHAEKFKGQISQRSFGITALYHESTS
jgi:hypothetical protein